MRFSISVAIPPEAAFPLVADFGQLDQWDPFVSSARLVAGESMEAGAVYELTGRGGLQLRYELEAVEEPFRAVYVGGTENVRSADTVFVERREDGSQVTITSQLSYQGRMRLLAPVVSSAVWMGGRFVSLPALRRHLARASD